MNPHIIKLIKELQFNTPFKRYFFPRYQYLFSPPQLCFLCQCIEETKNIEGSYAEIGCASGTSTIFLNKYMDAQGIKKTYYTIDTFSGFVAEDIAYEVAHREKRDGYYTSSFQVNKKKWFDGTMSMNGVSRVRSIQNDVNTYDLKSLGPIAFALVDVDLYRPMKKSLRELYDVLTPGGILVADDCDTSNIHYDGADQAYKEFMREIGAPIHIIHGKLGIIRKPA